MGKFFCVFLALLAFLESSDAADTTDYYDYSGYEDLYGEVEGLAVAPTAEPTSPSAEVGAAGKTFEARCDWKHLELSVRKHDLPVHMKLHEPRVRVNGTKCVEIAENSTSLIYRVALDCPPAVTRSVVGSSFVYQHEALLVRRGAVVTKSNPYYALYTVLLDCEVFDPPSSIPPKSGDPVAARSPTRWGLQVYEHRVTAGNSLNCKRGDCPYAESCLEPGKVDGLFCICADKGDCKLTCPKDFYGCDRGNVATSVVLPRLQCISNGWLCDRRFDCKLGDDETSCMEVWSTWEAWSSCSATCGSGQQSRKRVCDMSFTKDPERCKLYKNALGCSRRCVNNTEEEREGRACELRSCSRVTCDRHRLTAVIPREPGMTSRAIESRMTIGSDPACAPSYNDTHVIFVTPLNGCNTSSKVVNDTVTYRNTILFKPNVDPSRVIMRDIGHSYAVTCRFKRRRTVILRRRLANSTAEVAALNFEHSDEKEWEKMEENKHYASGDGQFEFKMNLYRDDQFSQRYLPGDYPLRKRLRENIFVGVGFKSDAMDYLKLVLDECKATPTKKENASLKYVFIKDGCAVDDTVTYYDPGNGLSAFSIEAFKFSDAALPFVYFQCDVIVCDVADDDDVCRRNCSTGSPLKSREKRSVGEDDERSGGHVVQGPVIIEDENDFVESDLDMAMGKVVHWTLRSDHEPNVEDDDDSNFDQPPDNQHHPGIVLLLFGGLGFGVVGALFGALVSRRLRRRIRLPTHV